MIAWIGKCDARELSVVARLLGHAKFECAGERDGQKDAESNLCDAIRSKNASTWPWLSLYMSTELVIGHM